MEQRDNNAVHQRNLAWLCAEITANSAAYWSGQLDEIPSTIACSFAKISVCRSDSLAFLASSSKDATMYSTSRRGQHTTTPTDFMSEYLVAPEELISMPVLDSVPCMEELSDTMGSDVVGELLCVSPGERGTK